MASCQCQGIEAVFNQAETAGKLKGYRKKRPAAPTRLLVAGLREAGVADRTLLAIGAVTHSVLPRWPLCNP
jgi:hypothetical protein